MAINAQWIVNGTSVTSTTTLYTVPATTSATYAYARDLVVTNGGPSTLFIGFGTGVTGGATTSSFGIPAGGTVVLTQCQVSPSGVIGAISSGTSACYIGYALNVAYV